MEVVALGAMNDRRVADELKTQDFAIEIHGCGHVEDLQERAQAVKVERHGDLLDAVAGVNSTSRKTESSRVEKHRSEDPHDREAMRKKQIPHIRKPTASQERGGKKRVGLLRLE